MYILHTYVVTYVLTNMADTKPLICDIVSFTGMHANSFLRMSITQYESAFSRHWTDIEYLHKSLSYKGLTKADSHDWVVCHNEIKITDVHTYTVMHTTPIHFHKHTCRGNWDWELHIQTVFLGQQKWWYKSNYWYCARVLYYTKSLIDSRANKLYV
jgi:hypothetical protein